MSNYIAPIEEMKFVLNEVVELEDLCKTTQSDSSTVDIIDTILDAAGKLAKEEIEPINKSGDLEGVKINAAGEVVNVPVTAFDILYGHRETTLDGDIYAIHRGGFTYSTLDKAFKEAGFKARFGGGSGYDLHLVAFKQKKSEEEIIKIANPFLSPYLKEAVHS